MVLNLLAYCYIQVKDLKAAEKVVEEAYTRFPDYLFAKINYADLLLRQKKWVHTLVFGDVLDLSQLFKAQDAPLLGSSRVYDDIGTLLP